ncbi:MAG: MATE family efflux transporter [Actinobacteria bacterium]|nr:MATE family efflux transporter [Actinomycetota bacterium]
MEEREVILNGNLRKLLFRFSLPATIGLVVSALYNVVDTLYVGHGVGPLAIAGLAIVLPFQILMFAVGMMIGVGSGSIISRSLGRDDKHKAILTTGNGIILNFVISLIVMIPCYLLMDKILIFFGATQNIISYSRDYMGIIIFGFLFQSLNITGNNIIRAEGKPRASMYVLILGAVLNIILDPVFIFVFKMGVRGAAIATVLSQIFSTLYIFLYFIYGKSIFKINPKMFKPDSFIIREILKIGFPSFLMSIVDSMIFILFNRAIIRYGSDLYIAIMGIAIRVWDITIMPIIGISQGFSTITGFNYGAGKFERVKLILREALIWTTVISALSFIVVFGFPNLLLKIFTSDMNLISLGITPLRITTVFFITLGIQFIGGTLFQAIGKAIPALILNISRQIIFLIPAIIILPLFFKLNGIWFSLPFSDFLSTLMTSLFIIYELKIIKKMQFENNNSEK